MRMWIELTAGDRVSQRIRSGLGVIGGHAYAASQCTCDTRGDAACSGCRRWGLLRLHVHLLHVSRSYMTQAGLSFALGSTPPGVHCRSFYLLAVLSHLVTIVQTLSLTGQLDESKRRMGAGCVRLSSPSSSASIGLTSSGR